MALRGRSGKDVKKSSYYVWYLGAREAKSVDAMPAAIDYLLERERLQEPFKVTLQVSSKGLKIIQTVHPSGSTRSAVKQLVPGHAVLAAVQREDVVAATLLLPNPATNNPVHVHAYRCDSVETAELLGGQLKLLATHSESSLARLGSLQHQDTRLRSNLGSDGRSTRESESSEGSGELRHVMPIQATSIYESLAAELRAKLGRGNSVESETGPLLLPPRDYDTVHRARGNLTGIELRRCLNQSIVGSNGLPTSPTSQPQMSNGITPIVQESRLSGGGGVGGTRSAGSSGIGSDSAATPPPYQPHHSLAPRPSRPTRDSSSDDDWAGVSEEPDYLGAEPTSVSLPRVARSPERSVPMPCKPNRQLSPALHQQQHHHLQNGSRSINHIQPQQQLQQVPVRRSAEHRQRSPSPIQYRSRTTATGLGQQHQQPMDPALMLASPRERFHDAKELFRQMEREAGSARPIVAKINSRTENSLNCRPQLHRSEPVSRQSSHEEPPLQAEPNPRLTRSQHQFGQSPTIQTSLGTGAVALNGCHSQQQHQHERLVRRGAVPHHLDRQQQHQQLQPLTEQQQQQHISPETDMQQGFNRNGRTKPRAQHFAGPMHHELEQMRPRPRSFYEVPMAARELRGPRNPNDGVREARDFSRALQPGRDRQHLQQQQRPRPFTYGELAEHERYPGLDRENARPPLEIGSGPARYRHSYAEPPRLGLAALHPY